MGEIADAILDGEFCQGCGDFLGESVGYARSCTACGGDGDSQKESLRAMKGHQIEAFRDVLEQENVDYNELSPYHWRIPNHGYDLWPSTGKLKVTNAPGKADRITPATLRDILNIEQPGESPELERKPDVGYITDTIKLLHERPGEVDISHLVQVLGRARKQILVG